QHNDDHDRADHHRADHHRADHHRADHHRADHHRADHDRARDDRTGGEHHVRRWPGTRRNPDEDTVNRPPHQPKAPPPPPDYELGPPPAEAVARPRPPSLVLAVGLWLAALVLGAASTVLLLLDTRQLRGDLLAQVVHQFPNEAAATQQHVANLALTILIGSGGLVALLGLVFAVALHARRRPARRGVGALWLVGAVQNLFLAGVAPGPVLTGLVMATGLATVATVAMFRPPSNAWLAGRGAPS